MRPTANKGSAMTDDELQTFVLDLHHRSFSIDDIALQITEELVLKSLCEIKKRLVERDNSPLQKESEALYQTIHSVIGEHYGWK